MFNSDAVSTLNRLDATGQCEPSSINVICKTPSAPLFFLFFIFWSPYVMFTGLNLLLWGDLPELDDSDNEDSESPSEEECIR